MSMYKYRDVAIQKIMSRKMLENFQIYIVDGATGDANCRDASFISILLNYVLRGI